MESDELMTTKVPRALEIKSKLFGYELTDLLIIFLNLAISNLIFGQTVLRFPLVWGTTLFLALFLHFSKKGRPENYLQHLGELMARSSYFSAGRPDLKYRRFKQRKH